MNKDNDLISIDINLNVKEEGTLNESWLAMFGGAIETIMGGMFGGSSIPVNVRGTRKQVDSFQKTLGSEARYLKAMKRHGLKDPRVLMDKTKLDRAIRNFESETGIVWPFK
jgi:hypothetical protein